jgi:hypothetical protein
MPTLENPRHELFACGIAKGLAQRHAYLDAGYKGGNDAAVDASASALLRRPKVWARIQELQALGVEQTLNTVESLCAELDQARSVAASTSAAAAMVAATMGKAKLLGLITDKVTANHTVERFVSDVPLAPEEWSAKFGCQDDGGEPSPVN